MALITVEARQELIALYVAMFEAAPSADELSQMVLAREGGATALQVANTLAQEAGFTAIYPGLLTGQEFVDRLADNLLGDDVAAPVRAWAVNWALSALNSGMSRQELILTAIQALGTTTNVNYTVPQAVLVYKVEVASYYTVNAGLNGTLEERQSLLANVDETEASQDAAIAIIQQTSQSFTVTANAASANEGTTATFSVDTDGVDAGGTVNFTISGVSAEDVVGGSLTGTTTVDSTGKATISVELVNDLSTEGGETLTVTAGNSSASQTVNDTSVTPVYTVVAGAASASEGSKVTFTVTADSAISGTAAVSITGIDAADAVSIPTSVTIVDGVGTIEIELNSDVATEGEETISVTVGSSTATTTVTDSSMTPILGEDNVSGTIVSGQGTAMPFVVVATLVLAAVLVGTRLAWWVRTRP